MWSAYIKGNRFVLRHLTKICGHLVLSNQLLNQNIYIYFCLLQEPVCAICLYAAKKKEKRIKKLQTWKQINCMPKNLYKKNVQVKGQMWDFASVFGSCDFLLVCVCVCLGGLWLRSTYSSSHQDSILDVTYSDEDSFQVWCGPQT